MMLPAKPIHLAGVRHKLHMTDTEIIPSKLSELWLWGFIQIKRARYAPTLHMT